MPLRTRQSFTPGNVTRLVRQHRPYDSPFIVGEFLAHDLSPQFSEFESRETGQTQRLWLGLVRRLTSRSGHQAGDNP
jgi:hypothetical protein